MPDLSAPVHVKSLRSHSIRSGPMCSDRTRTYRGAINIWRNFLHAIETDDPAGNCGPFFRDFSSNGNEQSLNGNRPYTIAYRTTPVAQTSDCFGSYGECFNISGLAYAALPQNVLLMHVDIAGNVGLISIDTLRANPKSLNLRTYFASSNKFSNFKSRCTMSCECKYLSAEINCRKYLRASHSLKYLYSRSRSRMVPFSANSIAIITLQKYIYPGEKQDRLY